MSNLLPAVPKATASISPERASEIELQVWEAAPKCDDLDALIAIERQLAGWIVQIRDKELQLPVLGAQRRAEARIGQLLGVAKRGKPSTSYVGHDLNKDDAVDFRLLARGLDELNMTHEDFRKSRRALVKHIKYRLSEELGEIIETPALPEGQYKCIVADPPWELTTGPGFEVEGGSKPLAYDTMTVEAIKDLDVEGLAADDAHLYLWTVNKYVEASYAIARAWGFTPSTLLVWGKAPHGTGIGGTYRLTTEFILFARRGSLEDRRIVDRSWFDWPRSKHSVKPDAFYEMVESVTPGPERLDMFARKKRKGWDVWGLEAPE